MTLDRELQLAAFKSQDAFPALLETYDDPFFEQPWPSWAASRRGCCGATPRAASPPSPVHKQDGFADEVIDTELDNVLDRGKDIATRAGRRRSACCSSAPSAEPRCHADP